MDAVTQELQRRFWQKVDLTGDCWIWTGVTNRQGYGQFWDPQRRTMGLAHRFAYETYVGDLRHHRHQAGPVGQVVCHRCDNPSCVRPAHLFVGTQRDNVRDAVAKGRLNDRAGSRNPRARLTPEDVAAIRAYATGRYGERSEIARRWGISTGYVSKILQGSAWM